jgi:hypothetical protein
LLTEGFGVASNVNGTGYTTAASPTGSTGFTVIPEATGTGTGSSTYAESALAESALFDYGSAYVGG